MGHEPASHSADLRLENDLAAVLRASFNGSLRAEPNGSEWIDAKSISVQVPQLSFLLAEAARPEIETDEEFDELPIFTVLRDAVGVVCELQDTSNDEDGSSKDWFAVGDGQPTTVELPALLLYAPVSTQEQGYED
ncbi:hypothetical protein A5658_03600 [Mycobacterium sp. 1245111.1]|uniref:hypothetical protein n=1 Tax=Mycobacterium sp. 1245111.1 TaxID=1834073 RepID=UPI000800C62C|nr:hypothetical protein [Mycobacterium sp. 1245111.1]OBK38616.1 hypothetical protein A5658_03600 [Mycobacterium sp. 1245111.1]